MTDGKKGITLGVIGTGAANIRFLESISGGAIAPSEIKDPIEKTPDVSGPHGRAWMCDLAEGRLVKKINLEDDATLVAWLIEAPWAHPIWHSFVLYMVHLRPMPDARKTTLYLEDATHEFWVYALDPDKSRHLFLQTATDPAVLHPVNFAAQFHELSDDLAMERIKGTVQMICDGKLSPDTDHTGARGLWAKLFNSRMIKPEYK